MSFWEKLQKPFFVLAPMADVTDAAFRRVISKYSAHLRPDDTIGGPDVMWTEFVSADGLSMADAEVRSEYLELRKTLRDSSGAKRIELSARCTALVERAKLLADLLYGEEERPIVAQLFSSNPAHMEEAAALCKELGFDGIDINMGCPDRSIEKQGCGAAMMRDPERAREIIAAAKRGAESALPAGGRQIPVSVKTRLGYNKDELEVWLPALLHAEPAAVTIHARTRAEMSNVPAMWERVKRAVEIRNECDSRALIIGNGDAADLSDARVKARDSGADGVMLGRAIFGNPWLFHPEKDATSVPLEETLRVMVEHTKCFAALLPHKSLAIMKKHYKAYVRGFDGAASLRARLMEAGSVEEIEGIVEGFMHGMPSELFAASATL